MKKYYYHFVGATLRNGLPIPKDGEWLEEKGPIRICKKGLHASEHVADALSFAPGETLCLVELDDIQEKQEDKVVGSRRKIVARFGATALLRADARESAKSVLKHWKSPIPQEVLDWLITGDELYRSAAESAARSAAWSAAESAAGAAAWSAARERLQTAVNAKFRELGAQL